MMKGKLIKEKYHVVYDSWVKMGSDKLKLTRDKLKLEAQIIMLQTENSGTNYNDPSSMTYPEILKNKLELLQGEYVKENDRENLLERELNENNKKIRMFNKRS